MRRNTTITQSTLARRHHLPGTVKDSNGNPAQRRVLDGHVYRAARWSICGHRSPRGNTLAKADMIHRTTHASKQRGHGKFNSMGVYSAGVQSKRLWA